MTAKILLLILGLAYDGASLPMVQQFDTTAACSEAANKVDFSNYTRAMVVCADVTTGAVVYLRAKTR